MWRSRAGIPEKLERCVCPSAAENRGFNPLQPSGAGRGSLEALPQAKAGGCSSVEYKPSRVHVDKFFNKPCGYREAGFSLSHSCSNSLLEMEGRGNFQRSHVMARQTTTSKGSAEAKTGPSNDWQPVCRWHSVISKPVLLHLGISMDLTLLQACILPEAGE